MKNYRLLLLILFFLFISNSIDVFCIQHKSSGKIAQTVFNKDYRKVLFRILKLAEKSIRIGQMCLFVDGKIGKQIFDVLIKAKARGVDVIVFLEGDKGTIAKRNLTTKLKLQKYGIKVFFDSKNKVVHAKFVVVDDRIILAGSTNMTDTSMNKNNESNILVCSSLLGKALSDYHSKLIGDASQDVNIVSKSDRGIQLVTDRMFGNAAIDVIKKARSELIITTYLFEYKSGYEKSILSKMFNEVVRAHNRGVDVRIVLEQSNMKFNEHIFKKNLATTRYLKKHGIKNIRFDDPDKISHMKFIIADHKIALLGSVNWYWRGIDVNHQVNWIIRDQTVVSDLIYYFNNLYKEGYEKL